MKSRDLTNAIAVWLGMFAFSALAELIYAQGPGGPGPPPAPGSVPLDPFAWMLLVSAGALAAKKVYDNKKRKSHSD